MRPTIRLGRIAGIEVGIHWSLLVIGVLLVGSLAGGELPALAPHAHGSYLAAAVLAVVLFFASILAHELAHSIVARRQGQTVDGITLWLLGGVSKLAPKPATRGDEFRVAIAGPGDHARARRGLRPARARVRRGRRARHVAADRRRVARGRQPRPRRLQPPARRTARRRSRARRDALEAQRRSPRARRSPPRVPDASSAACSSPGRSRWCSPATTSSSPRSSACSCSARSAPGRELARACCARSTIARSARSCDRSRSPPPTGPPSPRSDPIAEPTLLLGWDGTPTALLPPGAVFAVPPEAREHVQLRALGVPLAQLPRVPSDAPRHRRRRARACPRSSTTPTATRSACSASTSSRSPRRRDPVLARSSR